MFPISSSSPVRPATSHLESSGSPVDGVKTRLDNLTKNKHVMVFSGFSGLGYADTKQLNTSLTNELDQAITLHGAHNLCVAAGATKDGIGMVYEVAKGKGLQTIGIVSEHAQNDNSISDNCDEIIYIPDPHASWKVLDDKEKSYMTYVASQKDSIRRTGEFLAFGGGTVTLSELREASRSQIKTTVYPGFMPDPDKAASRKEQDPNVDLTPVLTESKSNNS